MIARRRRLRKTWLVPCLILGGFLLFVGIRMAICDTEIARKLTYVAPLSDYSGISYQQDFGQWAVALNGKAVAKSSENSFVQPTASTAKMIMALAVMEKKPFALGEAGETISITSELYSIYANYVAENGSVTAVEVGEEISEYDALSSALIASSNNMADSLAIWAFSSMEEYQNYATEMLKRLGATETTVGTDASGFSESTTSTAADLALIGEAVLRQPVLAEIVGKPTAIVPVAGLIENTNKLLGNEGIIGIKTGYIGDASGYCLISGYKEGEDIVTLAVLGAPYRQTSFSATLELVTDAKAAIKNRPLVETGAEVGYFESWWIGRAPITARQTVSGVIISDTETRLNDDTSELSIKTKETTYSVPLSYVEFSPQPTFWQRFLHVFGWIVE